MANRRGPHVQLSLNFTPLLKSVQVLDDRLDFGITAVFERQKNIAEGWMRENAPWRDRTGNARSGLGAEARHVAMKSHTLILFGRMPYNIWLESRFQGRYAVIIPAIIVQGGELMRTLNNLFSRLGGG
jgi:hypothetical protein